MLASDERMRKRGWGPSSNDGLWPSMLEPQGGGSRWRRVLGLRGGGVLKQGCAGIAVMATW